MPSFCDDKSSINMYLRGIIKSSFNINMGVTMYLDLNINKYLKAIIGFFILFFSTTLNAGNGKEHVYEERYRQAGHPSTSAALFKDLSLDKDAAIRKRVASNRKTPKEILLLLARDLEQSVKISVATNLSAPNAVYPILAHDDMIALRSVVARFEYVPVIALKILAKDKEVDIRREVARNLNTNKEILLQLIHDSDSSVSNLAELALERLSEGK